MNWRPHFITTRQRPAAGTSLIEVLVACTIFLGMSTVLLSLLTQNTRASQKISNHSDTSSQMMMVYEKVRSELRHGRIIGAAGGSLQYWICRVVSGTPQLTGQGSPDWLPGLPANPDVAAMSVRQGALWRDFEGQAQLLAQIGPDGTVNFTWDGATHKLELSGAVGQKDAYEAVRNNYQTFSFEIFMSNNQSP